LYANSFFQNVSIFIFFNLPIYAGCLILFLFSEEKLNTTQKVNVRLVVSYPGARGYCFRQTKKKLWARVVVSLPRKGISFAELRERENAGKRKSTNINEENC
jgi:hypothetical protein